MTSLYDKKQFRSHIVSYLKDEKEVSKDDLQNIDFVSAAVQERVDLLLWQSCKDIDNMGIKVRQKEYALWHLRIKNTLSQTLHALNKADIPVLVLRGLALAETLYGQAYTRPQSDIDLIFEPKHVLQAKQVLWDIGFRPDSVYADMFVRGDIQLDLHAEPLGIERIQAWKHLTPLRSKDFFNYAEAGELAGEKALLLHPRVNLPYLCFHALKHSFERLLWLYDIALLANDIDDKKQWDEVLQGIDEYALQRPCFYALSYAKEHFNAAVPANVLDALCPNMGFIERRLFKRHMNHEVIPYLAERLFARMQPDLKHRMAFWKETIYPRYEVRKQMANGGCVKCSFIRKRLRQLAHAGLGFFRESIAILRS
jgi:hypothetical protein